MATIESDSCDDLPEIEEKEVRFKNTFSPTMSPKNSAFDSPFKVGKLHQFSTDFIKLDRGTKVNNVLADI